MLNGSDNSLIYIGTYTSGSSEGIYALNLDMKTGNLEHRGVFAKLKNPSYLTISQNNKYLYSVLETDQFEGNPSGAVGTFSIDRHTGELKLINYQSTEGKPLCHITTDRLNQYLFAANYKDGTLSTFPINIDGHIGSMLSKISHQGSGPNIERQEKPHAHFVSLTPNETHLCAVDLGIDKVILYAFNHHDGSLIQDESRSVIIKPGSGPRHLEFHPFGKFVYLINELSCDVVVMEYSNNEYSFKQIQCISTLPAGYTGANLGAAIHISPDGNYLYTSNRGHDSIAAFKIDETSGKLSFISHTSTSGEYPRDFDIHPSGQFLVVANQNSNSIVPFSITKTTGKLERVGNILSIGTPTCVKFTHI